MPVRRTFPSGASRLSPRTGASSRRRSSAGPRQPPSGPRTRGTRPRPPRPARPPGACATGVPYATAWHDTLRNRTRHQAGPPASAARHKPDSPSPRPARRPRTPRQRRSQATQNGGMRNRYSEAGPAHQNGGEGTTGTSTAASVIGTTRACPSTMLPHRETPRSPTESSSAPVRHSVAMADHTIPTPPSGAGPALEPVASPPLRQQDHDGGTNPAQDQPCGLPLP